MDDFGSDDTRLRVTSRSSRSSLSCNLACSSNSSLLFDGSMCSSFIGTGPKESLDCCNEDVGLLLWRSVVGGRAEEKRVLLLTATEHLNMFVNFAEISGSEFTTMLP